MTNEPHGTGARPGLPLPVEPLPVETSRPSPQLEDGCGRSDGAACIDEVAQGCARCRMSHEHAELLAWRALAASHFVRLTVREREVMEAILAGRPNKNVAADLGISQRTVENHRASIMRKTGSRSLPALSRLELAATWSFEVPHLPEIGRPGTCAP